MSAAAQPLRSPLTWFGGKGLIAHKIIPLLPPHECYVEPFFGGGSIFWRKGHVPVETINDIDDGVIHFYRVLRDPAQFESFRRLCELTPYARAEFENCRRLVAESADPVERAWAWFVCVRQAFAGGTGTGARSGWKYSVSRSWASAEPESRRGPGQGRGGESMDKAYWGYRTGNVGNGAGKRWLSCVEGLPTVHERLQGVQIEHGDWTRVMDAYAKPDVCCYLDPPYVMETRGRYSKRYAYELADAVNEGGTIWTVTPKQMEADVAAHHALVDYVLDCPSMIVLSGYRYPAVHDRLEERGWQRIDLDVALSSPRQRVGVRRVESVWRNPSAVAAWMQAQQQQPLFNESESEEES